eukprot:m.125816 g.125816  ORF g.125816 m.125816 type:complete len:758 (-) comp12985_c0_seq23:942-3215(-)
MTNFKLARKLYDAVKKGDVKGVQKYLDLGADPNLPVGKEGRTSVSKAEEKGFTEIQTLLFEYGGKQMDEYDAVDTHDHYEEPQAADEYNIPQDTVSPEFSRFSSLADGVRESVRRKKTATTSSTSSDWSNAAKENNSAFDNILSFNRNRVKQIRKLGEGHFGVVFEGEAEGLVSGQKTTRVAVKMLTESTTEAILDFNKEVQIMKSIAGSDHIVQLLGICVEEQPYLMLMELMSRGDLKTLMRSSRPKLSKASPLSLRQLLTMGSDIADGMAFLQAKRIVHRDLAARNCLVNDEWRVKIGDFGLTRDVYAGEYYRMTGSSPLPVRWMAPEAIEDGLYTSYSDVWAYGIVLWELATFAKMPYPGLSNMEVIDRVAEEDYRMPEPKDCPTGLYKVMLQCWSETPSSRPDFKDLKATMLRLAGQASNDPITKQRKAQLQEQEQEQSNEVVINGLTYLRGDNTGDEGGMYTEDMAKKYPDLSSFQLAVKVAKDQSSIERVRKEDANHNVIVSQRKSQEKDITDLANDEKESMMSVKEKMAAFSKQTSSSSRSPTTPVSPSWTSGLAKKKNVDVRDVKARQGSTSSFTNTNTSSDDAFETNDMNERKMSVSAMKSVWMQHSEQAKKDAERSDFSKYKKISTSSSPSTSPKQQRAQAKKEEKVRDGAVHLDVHLFETNVLRFVSCGTSFCCCCRRCYCFCCEGEEERGKTTREIAKRKGEVGTETTKETSERTEKGEEQTCVWRCKVMGDFRYSISNTCGWLD